MNILKKYTNKKLLIEVVLSFILGLIIITILLTTNSESCIRLFFLFIPLITLILSCILQFNQKNIKNICNTLLSDDFVGLIIPWSFLLELIFLEFKKLIEYIFTHFTWPYLIITCFIISGIILSLMIIIDKYIEVVNKNIEGEIQKNVKNTIKWLILSGYSIGFSSVYFLTEITILYLTEGIIISINLIIFLSYLTILFLLYIYFRIHLKISENINKENLGNILGNILAAYSLLSLVIYLIVEKSTLIIAMIYMALSIILPLIAIKYINKKEDHSNSNLMSKK